MPVPAKSTHVDVSPAVEVESPTPSAVVSAPAKKTPAKETTDVHVLVHGRLTVPLQLSVTEALRGELGGEGLYRETLNEAIKLAVASQFCGFRGIEVTRVRPLSVAAPRKGASTSSHHQQRGGAPATTDNGGLVEAAQSLRNRYIRPPAASSGGDHHATLSQDDLVAHPATPAAATHAVPFAVPRAHLSDGDAIVAAVDLGAFRGNLDQLITSYDTMAARLEALQQGPIAAMEATLNLLEAHQSAAGKGDQSSNLAALVTQLREQQRVCALLVQEALAPPAASSSETEQQEAEAAEDAEAAAAAQLTPEELSALQKQQRRLERRSLLDASDDDDDVTAAAGVEKVEGSTAVDGEARDAEDDDDDGDNAYLRRRGFDPKTDEDEDSEFNNDDDMDPRQMGYVALEESE